MMTLADVVCDDLADIVGDDDPGDDDNKLNPAK